MSEPSKIETTIRYIAGFSTVPGAEGDEPTPVFSVFSVLEADGQRIATSHLIPEMSREQAEHLHMQLSNALGIFPPTGGE